MPKITPPDINTPITRPDGTMADAFQRWTTQMTRLDLIIGTGSPEGVIEATVGRAYMDETGVSGALLYMKRDADIGGDKSQGWVAA